MKTVTSLLLGAALTLLLSLLPASAAEVEYKNTETTSLGHALYIAAEGDTLKAIASLLLADTKNELGKESDISQLYIAKTLNDQGLADEAGRYYLQVANNQDAKQSLRDEAWLNYATIKHDQGDHQAALTALRNIKKGLSDRQKNDAAMITAHALLAAGKIEAAIDAVPRSLKNSSRWALYQHYNLGSLLLGEHNNKYGAALLHTLSEIDIREQPELAPLKDQANLALGYSLLKISKAGKARNYLQQVRINNMMSNMALLGMGWSYAIEQNYEKALVYWLELYNRPLSSTYKYEASLAIPYAFGQARAANQSISYYKEAMNRLETDAAAMNAAKAALSNPDFSAPLSNHPDDEFGWINSWQPDPHSPETLFLPLLMDSPDFQRALMTYRALLKLSDYVAGLDHDINRHEAVTGTATPALRQQHQQLTGNINQAIEMQQASLQQLAGNILDRYQKQLGEYLQQARFGMAQVIEQATQNQRGK